MLNNYQSISIDNYSAVQILRVEESVNVVYYFYCGTVIIDCNTGHAGPSVDLSRTGY